MGFVSLNPSYGWLFNGALSIAGKCRYLCSIACSHNSHYASGPACP
jgi:hypothetical protein